MNQPIAGPGKGLTLGEVVPYGQGQFPLSDSCESAAELPSRQLGNGCFGPEGGIRTPQHPLHHPLTLGLAMEFTLASRMWGKAQCAYYPKGKAIKGMASSARLLGTSFFHHEKGQIDSCCFFILGPEFSHMA